jgi:hypothetical protein
VSTDASLEVRVLGATSLNALAQAFASLAIATRASVAYDVVAMRAGYEDAARWLCIAQWAGTLERAGFRPELVP